MGNKTDIQGSIMVVGAGIAGMQSALDLADSGFKVHLVEKKASIGGGHVPAGQDLSPPTTVPCESSHPNWSEVGRHLNIELHTLTQVQSIDGEKGNFSVTLKQSPQIRGYGQVHCLRGSAPKNARANHWTPFNEGIAKRKAIYVDYPQAVPLKVRH